MGAGRAALVPGGSPWAASQSSLCRDLSNLVMVSFSFRESVRAVVRERASAERCRTLHRPGDPSAGRSGRSSRISIGVGIVGPCGLAVPVVLGDVLILAEAFGEVEQVTPRLGAPRCQIFRRLRVQDDAVRT